MRPVLAVPAAALLFATAPAWSAAPVPPSPAIDAIQALLRELQPPGETRLPLQVRLERAAQRQPSPATAAKLRDAFGTDRLYTVTRQPARPGEAQYRTTILALHHETAPGSRIDWEQGSFDVTVDRTGLATTRGDWPQASIQTPDSRVTMQGLHAEGRQRRSGDGLSFGDMHARIASLRGEAKTPTGMVPYSLENVGIEARGIDHRTTVDIAWDNRIDALAVAGQRVEDVRFAFRVVNVDRKALVALNNEIEKEQALPADLKPEQRLDAMKPMLRTLARAVVTRGAALEIDEISARYHGNQAKISGRIAVEGGPTPAQLDDLPALLKKIVATFDVRVPLALVRDVAGAVARNVATSQAAQRGAPPPSEADIERLGQTFTDVVIGRVVGAGYGRVENEAIVSTLEWRDGLLRANGKALPLPEAKPAAPAIAPPALPAQTTAADGIGIEQPAVALTGDVLRARQIEDSCRLPDYPEDIVRADQPLQVTLGYRVDMDGKVRDAVIKTPSERPAWDGALLAAMAACAYMPALQDGRPIAVPMTWTITRERGTRRPRDAGRAP